MAIRGEVKRGAIVDAVGKALDKNPTGSSPHDPNIPYVVAVMPVISADTPEFPIQSATIKIELYQSDWILYREYGVEVVGAIATRECLKLMRQGWEVLNDNSNHHLVLHEAKDSTSATTAIGLMRKRLERLTEKHIGPQNEVVEVRTYDQFVEMFGGSIDRPSDDDGGDDDG